MQATGSASPSSIHLESLRTSTLPNGEISIYLNNRTFSLTKISSNETYNACSISFLSNLAFENIKLSELIRNGRIGKIRVENHKVISLTLTEDMLKILEKSNITGVTLSQGNTVLTIDDNPEFDNFDSNSQYVKYIKENVLKS